jgi:hypothetical protein
LHFRLRRIKQQYGKASATFVEAEAGSRFLQIAAPRPSERSPWAAAAYARTALELSAALQDLLTNSDPAPSFERLPL